MSTQIALPQPTKLRFSWAGAARLTLPLTILITLIAELLLAERKYAIFGGGFGQSRVLDAPLEIGAFAAGVLLAHGLILFLLYRLVRRLHRRKADTALFHFNYAFFVGGGTIALLVAKYQALAFFSDAMSFQIVRNLGGGSLVDALLYSLSEAGLIVLALGGAALFYVAALLILRRKWRHVAPLPDFYRLSRLQLALLLAATPFVLFAVNRVDDSRSAAARSNGVLALSTLLHEATDLDRDGWSFFSYPLDRQPFDSSRHPYALDIPGDGIDQDGFGGDFAFSGEAASDAPPVIAGRKRNVVLLNEAGFSVPEAIRIATLNGAIFLGRADRIGSLEAGKQADIVLLDGDLMRDIRAIERPLIVFRNGTGYDSQAIYASLRGQVGMH